MTSGSQFIVMSPQSGSGSSDDMVTGVAFANCGDFTVSVPTLPFAVFRHCASGSGTGTAGTNQTKRQWTDTGPQILDDADVVMICDEFVIQNMTVPIAFHPTIGAQQTCTVSFTGSFGSATAFLKGTGVAPPFQISVRPSAIDFRDVKAATSVSIPVDIVNIGSQDLDITDMVLADGGGQYTTNGIKTQHKILVGQKDTFNVTCTPPTFQQNAVPGMLTIHSNATNVGGGTVVIPLLCRGIDTALIKTPGQVTMEVRTTETKDFDFTITNMGNQPSDIDQLNVVASGFDVTLLDKGTGLPPGAFSLGVNQSKQLIFRYTSATPQAGDGNLEIKHDIDKVDNVGLTFDARETAFGTNEASIIDFGSLCVGDTDSREVTVFSSKPGGFSVTEVSVPAAPFAWTGATGTVSGSGEEPLTFTARVMVTEPGAKSSLVTVTTDIPGDASHPFTLDVEGLQTGTNASPPQTDYGTVSITDAEIRLNKIAIRNCSDGDLTITNARIEGESAADFQILEPSSFAQPFIVPRRDKLDIGVAMAPKGEPGFRTATLVVEHSADGGQTTAQLDGTATGEFGSGPETYYQCNSGGSGGLFVGLTVVGLLVRRRRRL
jgi:large repetitive protein